MPRLLITVGRETVAYKTVEVEAYDVRAGREAAIEAAKADPEGWTIKHDDEFYVAGGEVAPPKPQEIVFDATDGDTYAAPEGGSEQRAGSAEAGGSAGPRT